MLFLFQQYSLLLLNLEQMLCPKTEEGPGCEGFFWPERRFCFSLQCCEHAHFSHGKQINIRHAVIWIPQIIMMNGVSSGARALLSCAETENNPDKHKTP